MIPATIGNLRITSSFEDEQSSFEDAGHLISTDADRAMIDVGEPDLGLAWGGFDFLPMRDRRVSTRRSRGRGEL